MTPLFKCRLHLPLTRLPQSTAHSQTNTYGITGEFLQIQIPLYRYKLVAMYREASYQYIDIKYIYISTHTQT